MRVRAFGSTTLRVSEIGLGCARIGGIFQQDPRGFDNLLAAAYDAGIRFFDTADIYSQGESEKLVGKAFRSKRTEVVIATKAGYVLPARRQLIARIKPLVRPLIKAIGLRRDRLPAAVRGTVTQDFSPAYLKSALEASLKRLRTDYVDLLQLHSPPRSIIEQGHWLRALEDLKRAGKVRYFGLSCDTVDAAEAALRVSGASSLQVVVNLLEAKAVSTVLPDAHARGVAVIARECLANGLLVKEEHEIDLKSFCSSPEQEAERREHLSRLRREAKERGVTLARLALDHVLSTEGVAVALVGARSEQQLRGVLRGLAS
jgi:aryl-alcohol dehydrogenase-like predicted oxidoreductase